MKSLYHLCSLETLDKMLCDSENGVFTMGLSSMSPCHDLNDELINRIASLKDSLFPHMDELIQNYEELKDCEESKLFRAIQLLYNYPYLFLDNKEFQIYSLSLMTEQGLRNNNNWKRYADDGNGVALDLDFSSCEHMGDESLVSERSRVYGKEAYYIKDVKNKKLIGILSAVTSQKLPTDEAYNKFIQDMEERKSYNMTGLSYALNDLYQKPEGHESDHEYRLSCILTNLDILKRLLNSRGLIPIETDSELKFIYNEKKNKKLLSFQLPIKCIKNILIKNTQWAEDATRELLKKFNCSIPIANYRI